MADKDSKKRRCFSCNRTGHFAKNKNYPARNQNCNESKVRLLPFCVLSRKGSRMSHVNSGDGINTTSRKAFQVARELERL
mgnify:CR=1 FL=1